MAKKARRHPPLTERAAAMFTGLNAVALQSASSRVRLLLCRQKPSRRNPRPLMTREPENFVTDLMTYLPKVTKYIAARQFRRSYIMEDEEFKAVFPKTRTEFRWYRFSVYMRHNTEPMEEEGVLRLVFGAHCLHATCDGQHALEFINSSRGIREYYWSVEPDGRSQSREDFSLAAVMTFTENVLLPRVIEATPPSTPLDVTLPPFGLGCTVSDDAGARVMLMALPPSTPTH